MKLKLNHSFELLLIIAVFLSIRLKNQIYAFNLTNSR